MIKKALLLLALACPLQALALEAMPDDDMAGVAAQNGIAIGLDYGVNTDATGAPLAELSNCADATAADKCRFAWKIAARDASGGEWTVFKRSYMSIRVDAFNLSTQSSMGALGSNTAYFDPARFQTEAGVCLVVGGCTTANIGSLPALKLYYPVTTTSYTPTAGGGTSAGYTSVLLGMTIGAMSMEYGANGYNLNNATGSFLSARIGDNNNAYFAGIAFQGSALVYGF